MPNYTGNFKIDDLNFSQLLNELEIVLLELMDKNGIDPKDFRLFKQLGSHYTVKKDWSIK